MKTRVFRETVERVYPETVCDSVSRLQVAVGALRGARCVRVVNDVFLSVYDVFIMSHATVSINKTRLIHGTLRGASSLIFVALALEVLELIMDGLFNPLLHQNVRAEKQVGDYTACGRVEREHSISFVIEQPPHDVLALVGDAI